MNEEALSRFLELCAREMDARDVRAEPRGTVAPSANVLVVPLGERSEVVVSFDDAPADIDARQRRLEMLATAFSSAIEGAGPERPKRVKRRSLRRELEALAIRADAIDAVVIDAHSPIVWGAVAGPVASPVTNVIPLNEESRARIERIQESHRDLIAIVDDNDDEDDDQYVNRGEAARDDAVVLFAFVVREVTAAMERSRRRERANIGDGARRERGGRARSRCGGSAVIGPAGGGTMQLGSVVGFVIVIVVDDGDEIAVRLLDALYARA